MSPSNPICRIKNLSVLISLAMLCLALPIQAQQASTAPDPSFSIQNSIVIGHLHSNKHSVTVMTGDDGIFYTVHSHEGKIISTNLSLSELIAQFPTLGETVTSGMAGNDASLMEINQTLDVR